MENNNNSSRAESKSATPDELNSTNISINTNDNTSTRNSAASVNNGIGGGLVEAAREGGGDDGIGGGRRIRRPFTDLSQEDADLALARTLQEQERAYMMLSMNSVGIPYGSWEVAGYGHEDGDDEDFDGPSEEEYDGTDADEDDDEEEEDAFDVHAHVEAGDNEHQGVELDPSAYSSDEAYARALQDAEEEEMAARLLALAGINDVFVGDAEDDDDDDDHSGNSQDAWEEVDPDEMSYEELIALGEVVGTESRGLSADAIATLPSVNYKSQSTQDGSSESCVICRADYEDGETLTVLSCKHSYHSECINNWLSQNKVCPICNAEISTSGNS